MNEFNSFLLYEAVSGTETSIVVVREGITYCIASGHALYSGECAVGQSVLELADSNAYPRATGDFIIKHLFRIAVVGYLTKRFYKPLIDTPLCFLIVIN